jgi:hypothetical protein
VNEIDPFEKILWASMIFLNGGLLVLLLYRKNHRAFPNFFVYVLLNFLQCFLLIGSYIIWGFYSPVTNRAHWGSQFFVSGAKAFAVGQICHRVLANYSGIWTLARRLFAGAAAAVLLYSLVVARGGWESASLNAGRGTELAVASVIVVFFCFTRYYEVPMEPAVRTLTVGFFLYSCLYVLNITLLEGWLYDYVTVWNRLGTLAFLATLLLWSWGLRERQPATTLEPRLLPAGIYYEVAPEINDRLRALNEHLGHFWSAERKRS